MHNALPDKDQLPDLQIVHDGLPDGDQKPALHGVHDIEPDDIEKVPAAHAVHATPENPALQAVANAVDDAVSETETDDVTIELTDELADIVGKEVIDVNIEADDTGDFVITLLTLAE